MANSNATNANAISTSQDSRERAATDAAQAKAADPSASAWVSANAGTGKTHVLTTRVLRLLVAGTPPERILCLTYTKAAAAEMSERVFGRLATWVTSGEDELHAELAKLQQRQPTADEILRARDLFAVAIEAPGGLKVQTIHAFCERLLQRFPLEADIAPGFSTLDEETGRALQREAIDAVLAEATRDATAPLGLALEKAVAYAADDAFDDLLRNALQKRDWLDMATRLALPPGADESYESDDETADELAGAVAFYREAFGVDASASLVTIDNAMAHVLGDAEISRCRAVLSEGSKTDGDGAERLAEARLATTQAQRIDALGRVFMTGTGTPRARLMTAALKKSHPDLDAQLTRAQDKFASLIAERGGLVVVEATVALLRLGGAVMQRYMDLKRRRATLDFEDLIRATANLLRDGPAAEWVLYKLDGGLDHILVDEAQDTAPLQWSIIEKLAAEFFAGSGARADARGIDPRLAAGKADAAKTTKAPRQSLAAAAAHLPRTVFAVGDEKQSIYGFQGAEPAQFAAMGERFRKLAVAAGEAWNPVPLTLSFRTVAPILAAVDQVFAAPAAARGVTSGGAIVRHAANRLGASGLIEIWATEKPDTAEPGEIWSPLEDKAPASAVTRLADRIAQTIEGWLASGERLAAENRLIRAGDIIVLVRKRRPFAEAMVAALKARRIAVAGADRIRLAEQLAILDLMVLGDFLLLPEDDLALATLLKSPFFDLDDDDLMAIAPGRRGSLWTALLAASATNPRFLPAAETLKRWRGRADLSPPFEFFAEVLDRDGMRARLLKRLGPEAAEPIDEFLSLALTYDDQAPPSLQGFIDSLRRSDRDIKRDMEHGRDEVRVLTVHGAKGLEAPIVFLPDTCTTGTGGRPGSLLELDITPHPFGAVKPVVWPVKGSSTLETIKAARTAAKAREAEERNRLLYVALTRPRDRLYIAGFEGARGREPDCWFDIISTALDGSLETVTATDGSSVRRLASAQTAPHETPKATSRHAIEPLALPDWAKRPAPREPGLVVPLVPSRLAPLETDAEGEPVDAASDKHREPPVLPPSRGGSDGQRFLRGTLTHALLQHLPGLDAATWEAAAARFIDNRGQDLKPRTRASIVRETLAVLRHPEFGAIFGPNSRAEVPIVAEIARGSGRGQGGRGHGAQGQVGQGQVGHGQVGHGQVEPGQTLRVTGQLDRIVQLDTHVLIIDYKTNRPPPSVASAVAEAYLLQLAAYRLAVAQVFDGLPVRAALLWTDGPHLMEIPSAMLDAATERLFRLETG